MGEPTYKGSSSFWDVLPTITGQYFDTRAAERSGFVPLAPRAPQAPAPAVSDIQRFLPLIVLAVLGVFVFRALK